MQRYRWPGYEMQLLGGLQKQQNNAQFCDTLLQTEGISVPTHSCILAALSPYLSQKLSASPSPPSGQKRQLQLQAVKSQTLLKLVSLLYTGELEVKGSVEQDDVLSAARQFGIRHLVKGQENGQGEGEHQESSCREKEEGKESRKMQDVQVQAEMAGKRDPDSPVERRSCESTSTQTVKADEKTLGGSFTHSAQTKHPSPVHASSGPLDKHCRSTACPHISSMHSEAQSDGESTLDRPADSVAHTTSTSALSSNMMTFPTSLNDDSNSLTPQEDGAHMQCSKCGERLQVLAKEGTGLEDGKTNGKTADDREHGAQPSHSNRDEMIREDKGNSTVKRHAHVGSKSLAKMKQAMKTTQISVKLKKRTEGEAWEVVSMRDADETLSLLTSLTRDGSYHRRPQADLRDREPPPSSVQPETPILQPATTNSIEAPPHLNTTSDSQLPGPAEECDEQIEKLLEDIMMGLNILPNVERDCKKSHYLPPNHDEAPAICQVPVTENERPQSRVPAAVRAAGRVYYQDVGTQIGQSSTNTGMYCCFTAQNQPSCSSLSSVQPTSVLTQQQQQQRRRRRFPQYHPSVTSMVQRDGRSHQGMSLSKRQNCPYPEAPTTRSVIPTALNSSGQKLFSALTYYPACQEPSSQRNPNILEFLPVTNGNEAQSSHSLPCMDDLRLPSCLSPLDQPTLNDSTDQSNTIQTQPSFHRRPWLTVNPGSLQFPLSAITHKANKSASFPQHTKHSCLFNPQNWGTRAALCTGKEVEERGAISASHQNVTELKSAPRKIKCEQGDTKGDAVAPKRRKRKCTSHPQEASSVLAFKCMKVSDETQDLRVCSVSLSSSNVLAKEREITAGSSNIPNKVVGKPNEPSTITDNLNEKTRVPRGLKSDPQTRIRTRGFLKKTQETPSNASIEDSALKPATPRAQIVNKEGVPKRGRGRPQKTKVEKSPPENSPALVEKKSQDVNREAQINRNLLEEEESEQNKRKSKKLRKNRGVEAIPLKKTRSAESTVKAVADDNNEVIPAGRKLGTPKQPQMVNLKEFQKLIKHQHSKAGRAKEMQEQESNETSRAVESEGNACGSRVEELPKETEMDIAQPQNRDGIKSTCGYLKSQRDDRNGSASEDTSLLVDESHPVFSVDVLGEDVSTLAAEREQPSKNPDEGVLDTTQHHAITDESSSHSDTHLPQQDEIPLNYNLNPQTPESTAPPLSDAVGFSKSSGCDQGETKEEEDVDVDVLIYSPDQVPQTGECENRLDCIEITPEEEEEEDVTEVDVTGDEAE